MGFPFAKAVGLFVIIAGVAATAVLVGLGISQGWVTPKATVWAIFDEARYIRTGDPVTLSGLEVGQVGGLSLTNDLCVAAELRIERRYVPRLTKNTVARSEPPLVLGPGKIRLEPDPSGLPLAPGDTLATEQVEGAQELVETVQEILATVDATILNLQQVSGDVAMLSENLSHPDSSFMRTMRATAYLAEAFSDADGLLPALLLDSSLRVRIDSTITAATQAARELHLLMQNVEHLVGSTDTLLVDASSLAGLLEESASVLNVELVPTLRELRLTLERIRSSWLLGGKRSPGVAAPGLWRIPP